MAVYEIDKYPYLKNGDWINKISHKYEKPVLRMCLGSKLLACCLGGIVIKAVFRQEIGIYSVNLLNEFWNVLRNELEVFQWHGDAFTLPSGAEPLAYNERSFKLLNVGRLVVFSPTSKLSVKWSVSGWKNIRVSQV